MDKKGKRIYSGLDILRILSTIAVVIYHIYPDLLPGGYLAVCVFLVLHGYLFIVSNDRRESFSIIKYWLHRIMRLYLPMIIVVCCSILALRLIPELYWLNLKPETMSVIECFNNWWQIMAGESYFIRVTTSPFTHMWYISMLLQVEVVLPFIYKAYRYCREKASFWLIFTVFVLLSAISVCVMPYLGKQGFDTMRLYYGTDARCFSILFGITLDVLHSGNKRITIRTKAITELLFLGCLGVLGYMLYTISPEHQLYRYGFVLSSVLTLIIISLVTNEENSVVNTIENKVTSLISSITYEVYLIHYPLMYILQQLNMFDIWLYVAGVIGLSVLLHYGLSLKLKKDEKVIKNVLKIAVLIPIIVVSCFGGYDIYKAEDYTDEMKELEALLEENAELQEQSQEEFIKKRQAEQDLLNDPDALIKAVDASSLPITCIGDSVMLGGRSSILKLFPNGEVDAVQNRSHVPIPGIITGKIKAKTLGNPIVIGIGTNGTMSAKSMRKIIDAAGGRQIYWLTTTNDWQFPNNNTIRTVAEEYDNVTVLDWEAYSAGHTEYFYHDKIHLNKTGRPVYARFILDGIARDLAEKQYAQMINQRTLGLGDGLLLGSVELLKEAMEDCYIMASEEVDFVSLIRNINELKENDMLPKRVFMCFGGKKVISVREFDQLFASLKGCEIKIINSSKIRNTELLNNLKQSIQGREGIEIVSWDKLSDSYLAPDKTHLNDEGKKALSELIVSIMTLKQ